MVDGFAGFRLQSLCMRRQSSSLTQLIRSSLLTQFIHSLAGSMLHAEQWRGRPRPEARGAGLVKLQPVSDLPVAASHAASESLAPVVSLDPIALIRLVKAASESLDPHASF